MYNQNTRGQPGGDELYNQKTGGQPSGHEVYNQKTGSQPGGHEVYKQNTRGNPGGDDLYHMNTRGQLERKEEYQTNNNLTGTKTSEMYGGRGAPVHSNGEERLNVATPVIKSALLGYYSGHEMSSLDAGPGEEEMLMQQEKILEEIRRRKEENEKEEEASLAFINQLKIQDEVESRNNNNQMRVKHFNDKMRVEHFNDGQNQIRVEYFEDEPSGRQAEFEVVSRRKDRHLHQLNQDMFPALPAKQPSSLPAKTPKTAEREEKARRRERERRAAVARELEEEQRIWEQREREHQVVEEMLKTEEKNRKVSMISADELLKIEQGDLDEQAIKKIPENLTEILMTTHKRKVRQEILRSVKDISNLQERLARRKDTNKEKEEYNKERVAMSSELKERMEIEEESKEWVREGDVVFLNEPKTRQMSAEEQAEDLLNLGRSAAQRNIRTRIPSWKKGQPGSSKQAKAGQKKKN